MKKCLTLSAAVLAATFSFAPLASGQSAQDRAQQAEEQAQRQAEQAREQAGQAGREATGQAQQAAAEARGEGEQHMSPDQHFIKEAAADNQFEIQLGQMVEQKAQNQQVKQLAQEMVRDHQQAQQQLEQVAKQMNMQVPTELEQWQQAKLQHMQRHQGEMMERAFAFDEVGAHHTDILKYSYEAEHAQNEQLKQFAQQTIPTLEKHMQLAEQAAEQWVPQARTAGEHMRGQMREHGTGSGSNTGDRSTPTPGTR
jgi:putative membrane protein